jgi:hypothetical protein
MSKLDNIKIAHGPLSDSIILYRHGKDPCLALDKRNATNEVLSVVVKYMMFEASNGSEQIITIGDKSYLMRVTPLEKKENG